MLKCVCGGELKQESLPFTYVKNDKIKFIPNVIHHVCQSCGEQYIDENESRRIDEIIAANK